MPFTLKSRPGLIAAVLAFGAALLANAPAQAAGQKTFKGWSAVCDNLATCVAFVFPEQFDEQAWLRIGRSGDPGAPVSAVIAVSAEEDPGAGGGPWTVTIDGAPVPGLGKLTPIQDDTGFWRAEIPSDKARALAVATREGTVMALARPGRDLVILPLGGAAATMIWIDEQQGRIGSPTALSRASGRPSTVVTPTRPIIPRGPVISQTGLPAKPPTAVLGAFGDCEGLDRELPDSIIARLAPGVILYGQICIYGAYNFEFHFALADEAGRGAKALTFPLPPGNVEIARTGLWNADYDPDTRVLISFAKGRGLGDCGHETQWVWDGKAFQVLTSRVMGACRGVPFDDWPTLFQGAVEP